MSIELLYTSAPQGLKQGSRGFCTVISTAGTPTNLAARLEALSAYRHAFPANSPEAEKNPVNFSHVSMTVGGQRLSVLSRVADYGVDYSQRTNKIAHHIVIQPDEQGSAGPAWLMLQPNLMRLTWDGTCTTPASGPVLPEGTLASRKCDAWQETAGDAGWGGVVADAFSQPAAKPTWIVFDHKQAQQLLRLINESIALLPTTQRWQATFSTYATNVPPDVDCRVRCVLSGTDEARLAPARGMVIDLTRPLGTAPANRFSDAARGVVVEPAIAPRASSASAGPVEAPSPSSSSRGDSDSDFEIYMDDEGELDNVAPSTVAFDRPPVHASAALARPPLRAPDVSKPPPLRHASPAPQLVVKDFRRLKWGVLAASLAIVILLAVTIISRFSVETVSQPLAQQAGAVPQPDNSTTVDKDLDNLPNAPPSTAASDPDLRSDSQSEAPDSGEQIAPRNSIQNDNDEEQASTVASSSEDQTHSSSGPPPDDNSSSTMSSANASEANNETTNATASHNSSTSGDQPQPSAPAKIDKPDSVYDEQMVGVLDAQQLFDVKQAPSKLHVTIEILFTDELVDRAFFNEEAPPPMKFTGNIIESRDRKVFSKITFDPASPNKLHVHANVTDQRVVAIALQVPESWKKLVAAHDAWNKRVPSEPKQKEWFRDQIFFTPFEPFEVNIWEDSDLSNMGEIARGLKTACGNKHQEIDRFESWAKENEYNDHKGKVEDARKSLKNIEEAADNFRDAVVGLTSEQIDLGLLFYLAGKNQDGVWVRETEVKVKFRIKLGPESKSEEKESATNAHKQSMATSDSMPAPVK